MTACCKCGYDEAAPVRAVWGFTVPRVVKSGNARISNVGGSRWAYKRDRAEWERDMASAAVVYRIPMAQGKRRVTLTRYWGKGQRAYDLDNLSAGLKPAIDALTKAQIIRGDRPQDAEIHVQQCKAVDGRPSLRVLVEEFA